MKLPDDKQQRIKVLIVILLASILGVLGIVQGIAKPLLTAHRSKLDRLQQCQDGIEEARRRIGQAKGVEEHNRELLEKIKQRTAPYLLQPVLNNFLLSATAIIEQRAQESGISTTPGVYEIGLSELPGQSSKRDKGSYFKGYSARVTLDGGYGDVVRLIREVETSNPYISITSLTIKGNQSAPERHDIQFSVQWPIWADPEMATKLSEGEAGRGDDGTQATPAG